MADGKPARILGMLRGSHDELAKLARFAAVGVMMTGLDYAVFLGLVSLGTDPGFSRLCSSAVSVIVSFPLNRAWSFRSRESVSTTALFYFITRAAAALIIQGVFELANGPLGFGANASFWISTVLYPPLNFAFARLVVFRK